MLCRALERVDLETRINKYRMMTADGFGSRDRTTHQQSDWGFGEAAPRYRRV